MQEATERSGGEPASPSTGQSGSGGDDGSLPVESAIFSLYHNGKSLIPVKCGHIIFQLGIGFKLYPSSHKDIRPVIFRLFSENSDVEVELPKIISSYVA